MYVRYYLTICHNKLLGYEYYKGCSTYYKCIGEAKTLQENLNKANFYMNEALK